MSEKVDLTYWPHPQGVWGGGGVCGQNICYHVSAFVIPFNLICNIIMFWKVELWPIDPIPGSGRSAGKIFATILLHSWFSLIWYATQPCSEKVEFWPIDPMPRVGVGSRVGVWEQNICYRASAFIIPFNLICNMTLFWKNWILTLWPHPLSPPRGWDTGLESKITFDMFHIHCTSVCMRYFSKNIDNLLLLRNLNIWPLTQPKKSYWLDNTNWQ